MPATAKARPDESQDSGTPPRSSSKVAGTQVLQPSSTVSEEAVVVKLDRNWNSQD